MIKINPKNDPSQNAVPVDAAWESLAMDPTINQLFAQSPPVMAEIGVAADVLSEEFDRNAAEGARSAATAAIFTPSYGRPL